MRIFNLIMPATLSVIIVVFTFLAGKNYGELKLQDKIDGILESSKLMPVSDFKVYTKAVCNSAQNSVDCRDELFVMCNNAEYRIPNTTLGTAVLSSSTLTNN